MIVFGVVLLALVVVVTVVAIRAGGEPVHVDVHWFTVGTDGAALFLTGAASLFVTLAAFWLLWVGIRRARRRRREIKDLRQRADQVPGQPGGAPAAGSGTTAAPPQRPPEADV